MLIDIPLGVSSKRHWTLRYIYNRAQQFRYDHHFPDNPWLTPHAIHLLDSMLRPSDRGVEYGSGRSTIWLAERVQCLTSVEHDKRWYEIVSAKLKDRNLANVNYIFAPQGQSNDCGDRNEYTNSANTFADESLDFALVDGICREHVTRVIIRKIRPGGFLIIDNVEWFLPSYSHAPYARTKAMGPADSIWAEIAHDLEDWRHIWTSSGVWDTAIFVKT